MGGCSVSEETWAPSRESGRRLTKGLNDDQALAMVDKVLQYYKTNAKKGERLGAMINRLGLDALKAAVS